MAAAEHQSARPIEGVKLAERRAASGSVNLETLMPAARAIGRELRLELV